MRIASALLLLALATAAAAQPGSVMIEDLTWPEVRSAIAAGKTTAIYYAGSVSLSPETFGAVAREVAASAGAQIREMTSGKE